MKQETAKLLYRSIQCLRGKRVFEHLSFLEETEKYSLAALEDLQWNRLKKMLAFSYENIPYYKELFDKTGIDVREIRDFDDFRSVPILTKEKVRDNLEKFLPRDPVHPIYFVVTSGSTGKPLKVGMNHKASGAFWAAIYRGWKWHGLDVCDPGVVIRLVVSVRKIYLEQKIGDFFLNRIRLGASDLTKESVRNLYERCLRFKPTYIYGYPSAINQFAGILDSMGLDGNRLKLKVIISTGEVLYPFQRENIESVFQTRVINEYGSAEFGACAFECPEGKMHITAENLYLEINQNSKTGQGPSVGDVLVTGLVNYAMPLIRYDLGDVLKLSDKKCACGRALPLLCLVEGRTVAFARDSSGNPVSAWALLNLIPNLFKKGNEMKQFKFIQKDLNLMVIQVVRGPGYNDSVTLALEQRVKRILGPSVSTRIDFVEHIPREDSGKLRFFASEIFDGDGRTG